MIIDLESVDCSEGEGFIEHSACKHPGYFTIVYALMILIS